MFYEYILITPFLTENAKKLTGDEYIWTSFECRPGRTRFMAEESFDNDYTGQHTNAPHKYSQIVTLTFSPVIFMSD